MTTTRKMPIVAGKKPVVDKIPGINRVTATLKDGREAVYYYHRATGTKLPGEYGSDEFLAALAAAKAKAPARDAGTLAGLLREFTTTARWRKLRESTQTEYKRVFKFWEAEFGDAPLKLLATKSFRSDVLTWHDGYSEKHPREADNRVVILASVLSWAAADRELTANVLDGFSRAYSADRADIVWMPEDVTAFMGTAPHEMQVAMMLALHTGQRQGDVLKMAWSNYNGKAITIRQGKTGRLVTIPCTTSLKAMLDSLPRTSTLILPTKTGRAFKKRYFSELWTAAARDAGLKPAKLHFHDLRGTTVTLLAEGGCSVGEIATITGHFPATAQKIIDQYLARTGYLATAAITKLENRMNTERAKWPAKWQSGTEAK